MIKVLITDDHPVVRHGLKQILQNSSEIELIEEAGDGIEMLLKILKTEFTVILLDISLPGRNGLDLIKDIKKMRPNTPVLILSIHPEEQYAVWAIKSGASGYLTKASAPEELLAAIIKVSQGGKYITHSLAERIAFEFSRNKEEPLHQDLSARELQVMRLMAQGKSTKEIALSMAISPKTVSTYRERILEKMNMTTSSEIIRYAIKNDLIE